MFAQCCFLIISHFGRLPNFLLLFFFEEFWTISFLWDLFGARPNVKIFLERNYSPPPHLGDGPKAILDTAQNDSRGKL